MLDARRTGRTTRMLLAALAAARSGREVLIIAHNANQVHHLNEILYRLVHLPDLALGEVRSSTPFRNIEILTPTRANLDWHRMAPEDSLYRDALVLVDHAVIETRFGMLLEMLHRYDLLDGTVQSPQELEPPALPPVGERRLKLGRKTWA